MNPKLLIFDFSGTLAYFPKYDPKEYFSALADLGLKLQTPEDMKKFGKVFEEGLVLSKNWSDFGKRMSDGFNLNLNQEKLEKLSDFFKEKNAPVLYDDAKGVNDLPFPKAILSAAARFLIESLFPEGFESFGPNETRFLKPDPRAFLCVLKKMGFEAQDAVMIGDEVERDLIPAKDLGMKVVLIDRQDKIETDLPKIKSLLELSSVLGGL